MSNIFITGSTGFLGSNLLVGLLTAKENNLYLLIRLKDSKNSLARKRALIGQIFLKSMQQEAASRISIIEGDVTKENLGLNKKSLQMLRHTIDTIYHCAAITELTRSISNARKVNVYGTQNILETALGWKNEGCLENVNHISTAYVAGDYKKRFYEEQLNVSQNFNNTYEQSKFEAEKVVREYRKKGLRVDIYRPSIIIDSIRAGTRVNSGVSQFLAIFALEILEKIPISNDAVINIVPVDAASKAIHLISTTKKRPPNQTYHIVNPRPIKATTLLNTASILFKFKKPKCIPPAEFHMNDFSSVQQRIMASSMPYLNQELSFDMRNAYSILKRRNFRISPINKNDLIGMFRHYKSSANILIKK